MEQHTGGKWLIHGAKHRMDNPVAKPRNFPVEYPSRDYKHVLKEYDVHRDCPEAETYKEA